MEDKDKMKLVFPVGFIGSFSNIFHVSALFSNDGTW